MQEEHGPRLDVKGNSVRWLAHSLGWTDQPRLGASQGPNPVVAVSKSDAPSKLVADLAQLVAAGAVADWWLSRLDVSELGPERARVAAVFSGGRRVLTSRAAAASAAQRRAAGAKLGRPPSIGPELLDRIAAAKSAGQSYRAIAADLEASGVPTPSGARRWYASTVRAAHLRLLAAD